jgi:hypothetical protein
MIDPKTFTKDFLAYLADYYGRKDATLPASLLPNMPKLPLFQQVEVEPQMDMGFEGMGMGDMGMGASEMGQLNGLFPGPYDPMRMN